MLFSRVASRCGREESGEHVLRRRDPASRLYADAAHNLADVGAFGSGDLRLRNHGHGPGRLIWENEEPSPAGRVPNHVQTWQVGQMAVRWWAMDSKTLARYEARAQVFKALAHPSRLLIVDELTQSERCVCELTALVGSDMSTVSKHLSVLKAAGVVEDERRGAQVWYRLRMKCVTRFFGCVETELQKQAREQWDLVRAGNTP
jgi:DNA-binding transcriptional ArsR family regulator